MYVVARMHVCRVRLPSGGHNLFLLKYNKRKGSKKGKLENENGKEYRKKKKTKVKKKKITA